MRGSEIALVERAKNGDSAAFNDLFLLQQRYVFNLMYQLCGDPAMADDLAQEAFIIAYQKINNFRLESSFRTWLSRIAINLFRERYRRHPKHISICLEQIKIPASANAPERTVIKRELQWCIAHTLQQHVPKKYRLVLVLRDLQSFSYKEIADLLGWSLSRTKTCIHRARQIFRNHFINGKCRAFAEDYLCVCEEILKYEM